MSDVQSVRRETAAPAATVRPVATTWAAWAGIIGPALFTAGLLALEVVLGSDYDRVSEVVSALEAVRYGWLQQINFAVFGLLTLAYSWGLHRGILRARRGIVGPALVGVSGVGLLLAAAFPLREDAAGV